MLLHHLGYALKQAGKNPFTFVLGSCTCLLVVTVAATLQSVLNKAPAVFLQEAEFAKGELDLELKPQPDWEFFKIPSVEKHLQEARGPQTSDIAGFRAARLYFGGQRLYRPEACSTWASSAAAVRRSLLQQQPLPQRTHSLPLSLLSPQLKSNSSFPDRKNCLARGTKYNSINVYGIDFEAEKRAEIGRTWNLGSLREGGAFVRDRLAADAGLSVGDRVFLYLDLRTFLRAGNTNEM